MHAVLFLSHLLAIAIKQIHVRVIACVYSKSANKFYHANRINRSGNTLLIIKTDWSQNHLPCLFVLHCKTVSILFSWEFSHLHLHIRFPTDELFLARMMSLHITQALRDNNLVTRVWLRPVILRLTSPW